MLPEYPVHGPAVLLSSDIYIDHVIGYDGIGFIQNLNTTSCFRLKSSQKIFLLESRSPPKRWLSMLDYLVAGNVTSTVLDLG